MTFEEAIRRSIKAYYKGKDATNLNSLKEEVRFTREYFDELEDELLNGDAPVKEDEEDVEDDG